MNSAEGVEIGASVGAFVVVVGLAVVMVFYPFFKCVASDGKADYCYVSTQSWRVPNQPDAVLYDLHQHISWRPDRTIAQNLKSLEEAKTEAARINCELR